MSKRSIRANLLRSLLAGSFLLLTLAMVPQSASAVSLQNVVKGPNGSFYNLTWDGFQGSLLLRRDGSGALYLAGSRQAYSVRISPLSNQQDTVSGRQGPGYIGSNTFMTHRVVFWIDLNNTPTNPNDDQRFDGYFFTQTLNGMAGVTWWSGIPFGFSATYAYDMP
jgi:hypothetical protein